MRPTLNPVQAPAEAAVVLPTILRPSLLKAARSVFSQNFIGRIHLLIGVDVHAGDSSILDTIQAECPDHVSLTILDPGYSTSVHHGGLYANAYGGALRTVLSYLANSRHIAYLDDNDWWGANHLTLLKAAIANKEWAWSGRWLVHPQTQWPICRDEWDSVGPGQGINAERFGGFVQPSGLMIDGAACQYLLPLWSMAAFADGGGEDRLIFEQLNKSHAGAGTGQFTSFCTLSPDSLEHDHHKREFLARGLIWVFDPKIRDDIATCKAHVADLIERQSWAEAESLLTDVLTLQPHLAEALALSATVKHATGRSEDAINTLAHAMEVDDHAPGWLDILADWLRQDGRLDDEARVRATRARRFSKA